MRVFKKIEGYTFWPGILVEEWRRSVLKERQQKRDIKILV